MKLSIITIYTLTITTIFATFLPSNSNKLLKHNLRTIEHTTPILKQSAFNEIQSQNTGAIATELKFDYRLKQVKNINDWNSLNEDLIAANKKVKKERLDIDTMTIQREFVQLREELEKYKNAHFSPNKRRVFIKKIVNTIRGQHTGPIATELKFDYRLEQLETISDWTILNKDLQVTNRKVKKERLDIDVMTIQREFVQLQEELKKYKSEHFEGKRSLVSRSKKRVRKFLNKHAKRLS
ncbi:hypothetical protein K502DRAFT_30509 [Neoconidiobolus thromboides FSU 785]|nr:hypothetical protein K502DRAFT_30509 [Neoconidiobolus thromboides FSU 785]